MLKAAFIGMERNMEYRGTVRIHSSDLTLQEQPSSQRVNRPNSGAMGERHSHWELYSLPFHTLESIGCFIVTANEPLGVTELLKQLTSGDEQTPDKLILEVYGELKSLASGKMRHQNPGHTLQATAVVHELWSKLMASEHTPQWSSRGHFYKWASKVMGNLLRDHARHKYSQKAGGQHCIVSLEGEEGLAESPSQDGVLDTLDAIEQLVQVDPELGSIVELRVFGGLTYKDIAVATEHTESQVEHLLRAARSWLRLRLEIE